MVEGMCKGKLGQEIEAGLGDNIYHVQVATFLPYFSVTGMVGD